jgi:NAD(P)H-dependent FMN reductase
MTTIDLPLTAPLGGPPETALNLPVLLGSVRPRRRSLRPARLLVERTAGAGHSSELIDLRELDLPLYGTLGDDEAHAGVRALRQTIDRADGLVVLSPEYNHSFTSAVKNAIDYLGPELRRKPVAVAGLSGGALGGVRAVEQLKQVLIELQAVPIRESVYFGEAGGLFDDEGNLVRDEFVRRVDYALAELVWYVRALKWGREHLPVPVRP